MARSMFPLTLVCLLVTGVAQAQSQADQLLAEAADRMALQTYLYSQVYKESLLTAVLSAEVLAVAASMQELLANLCAKHPADCVGTDHQAMEIELYSLFDSFAELLGNQGVTSGSLAAADTVGLDFLTRLYAYLESIREM